MIFIPRIYTWSITESTRDKRCGFSLTHWGLVTPWRHGTRSTLAQVMAWCLTAPSHYLNQCWLIIGEVPRHSSQGIILRWCEDINQWNKSENCSFKMSSRSPRGQWVKANTWYLWDEGRIPPEANYCQTSICRCCILLWNFPLCKFNSILQITLLCDRKREIRFTTSQPHIYVMLLLLVVILNKLLNKQLSCWWFEMPWCWRWQPCNDSPKELMKFFNWTKAPHSLSLEDKLWGVFAQVKISGCIGLWLYELSWSSLLAYLHLVSGDFLDILSPGGVFMHQWTGSVWLFVLACHLFGTKTFPARYTDIINQTP